MKTVCITGASSGIGEACARIFAANGYHLWLLARRKQRLIDLKESLVKKFDTQVHVSCCDIRHQKNVQACFDGVPDNFASVDVLINNAGLAAGLDTVQDADLVHWEQMIDTNVKGLLYVTRACLPLMLPQQKGHIINIGSVAGHEVYPKGAVYCATKHAVRALSTGLREDLLGTGLKVSSIDPGMVDTEFSLVRLDQDQDQADKVYQGMTPLHAEDVAQAVYFAAQQPAHVNVAEMLLLPTDQASATRVRRKSDSGQGVA